MVVDGVIQEVLSNKDADVEKLVKDANYNLQKNFLDYENLGDRLNEDK